MKDRTKIILAAVALAIGVPVGCSLINTTAAVTTAPGRVVQKTLRTDNIIGNYEAFFDLKAQYDARDAQIDERLGLIAAETDPAEKQRLRMELSATRQSCRDLARRYNADAAKANRGLFRSKGLPETLDALACDRTTPTAAPAAY